MFFPHVVVDLPDEPPEPHPEVLHTVRDAVVTERMVHDLVTIAKELGEVFVGAVRIGTHETPACHMSKQEWVQTLLFTVGNGPEHNLPAAPFHRPNHNPLVPVALLPNKGLIHLNRATERDMFPGQKSSKSAVPPADRRMGEAGNGFCVLQAHALDPAGKEQPERLGGQLAMGKRETALEGKFETARFTPETVLDFPCIPPLAAWAANPFWTEDFA